MNDWQIALIAWLGWNALLARKAVEVMRKLPDRYINGPRERAIDHQIAIYNLERFKLKQALQEMK